MDFGFCEFTLNNDQLYANISYVDFVPRLPIAINLTTENGPEQNVAGMGANGLDQLASALRDQARKDGVSDSRIQFFFLPWSENKFLSFSSWPKVPETLTNHTQNSDN